MEHLLTVLSVTFVISFGIFLWRLFFRRHLPKTKWFIISFITLLIFGYFDDKHEEKEAVIKEQKIISEQIAKKELEEKIIDNKDNWSTKNEASEKLYYAKKVLNLKDGGIFDTIESVSNYNHQLIGFFKTEIPYDQIFKENNTIYDNSTNKPANGVITLRDRLGKIYYKQEVKNGKKHGEYIEYYPNLNLKSEGYYSSGVKNKTWKTYFDNKNNQLETITDYYNGKISGSHNVFYENGKTEKQSEYLDGFRVGTWKGFFPDGTIEFEAEYKNDKEEGKWKLYYPNGNLKAIGKFSEGKKIEIWKYYYSNGKLKEEVRHTFLGLRLKD